MGRQIKTEKAKTEKTDKDGEGKKTEKAGGQLPYRESAINTSSRYFGLLQYLSVFSLVEMVSLFNGTGSMSESYLFSESIYLCLNRITVEQWKVRHLPAGCGLVGTVV